MAFASRRHSTERTTFSFDSSGWLYVYHLGVAHFIQQRLLPGLDPELTAFSGSSGGALVAAALCANVDILELTRYVISCHDECQYNPWRILPCLERALRTFVRPMGHTAHLKAERRLRVLLTRIQLSWRKPLFMPEMRCHFASNAELVDVLRASCHIPIIGGLLPYAIPDSSAYPGGAYYDGLFWPSVLYSWRRFKRTDTLLKASGLGMPTSHIRPPLVMPIHWAVLPPSEDTLWTLFACGYHDAERRVQNWKRGSLRDLARAPLPPGHKRPLPPGKSRMDRWTITYVIVKGWLNLLMMTIFVPFVPPYFAYRELSRLQPGNRRPGWSVIKAVVRRSVIVALLLMTWPFVELYLFIRWTTAPNGETAPSVDRSISAAVDSTATTGKNVGATDTAATDTSDTESLCRIRLVRRSASL